MKIHQVRYIIASELPKSLRQAALEVVSCCMAQPSNEADIFMAEDTIYHLFVDGVDKSEVVPGMKKLCRYLKARRCMLYVG